MPFISSIALHVLSFIKQPKQSWPHRITPISPRDSRVSLCVCLLYKHVNTSNQSNTKLIKHVDKKSLTLSLPLPLHLHHRSLGKFPSTFPHLSQFSYRVNNIIEIIWRLNLFYHVDKLVKFFSDHPILFDFR